MQMHAGAHVRHAGAAAVQGVVDGQEVLLRKIVHPLNLNRMAAARFDHRSQRAWAAS